MAILFSIRGGYNRAGWVLIRVRVGPLTDTLEASTEVMATSSELIQGWPPDKGSCLS